jgi:hypothetical protein
MGASDFNHTITDLTHDTEYDVQAWAQNMHAFATGENLSFTTVDGTPTVNTYDSTAINETQGTIHINLTYDGETPTEVGIYWRESAGGTTQNTSIGTYVAPANITYNLTSLTHNTESNHGPITAMHSTQEITYISPQ